MSILIIGEKPSVSNAISQVVGATGKNKGYTEGNGYIVSWCYGHLAGLAEPESYTEKWSGKWNFDQLPMIPDNWKFKVPDSAKEQFGVLKKLMNDSSVTEIICATDADREGECIFRYVYNLIRPAQKPVKRLWISSLEETAIKDGLRKLKPISEYDNLFYSGFSRAKSDWLVGMNCSRLFTCRYNTHLNIGRVQTPTLAMIVKRDNEVSNFVKQKYFTVDIYCGFKAVSERIDNENKAAGIADLCNGKQAIVNEIEKQYKSVNPPKLYDLTTLQRDANRMFGFTAQQTLDYLQALYEGKLATYPRTDSQYLSEDMRDSTLEVTDCIFNRFNDIRTCCDPDIGRCINNQKVTGHHAIIPTVNIKNADLDSMPEGQKKILMLIAFRLICAVSEIHRYTSTRVVIKSENNLFTATGTSVTENGWKSVYSKAIAIMKCSSEEKEDRETVLPELSEGMVFKNISAAVSEHWTSPHKPYTEDTLLSAMEHAGLDNYDDETEKKGLGTPSTRAKIIETLVQRGYAQRNKKQIISTEKGKSLIAVVPDEVKSPELTADWETQLQQIEKGTFRADAFMNSINEFIRNICNKYGSSDETVSFSKNQTSGSCPRCGKEIAKGKFGFYCTGKCGMQIGKVYKKELTESQLVKLLSGSSVSYTENSRKTTVLPEIEPFSYTTANKEIRSGFQWKVKK